MSKSNKETKSTKIKSTTSYKDEIEKTDKKKTKNTSVKSTKSIIQKKVVDTFSPKTKIVNPAVKKSVVKAVEKNAPASTTPVKKTKSNEVTSSEKKIKKVNVVTNIIPSEVVTEKNSKRTTKKSESKSVSGATEKNIKPKTKVVIKKDVAKTTKVNDDKKKQKVTNKKTTKKNENTKQDIVEKKETIKTTPNKTKQYNNKTADENKKIALKEKKEVTQSEKKVATKSSIKPNNEKNIPAEENLVLDFSTKLASTKTKKNIAKARVSKKSSEVKNVATETHTEKQNVKKIQESEITKSDLNNKKIHNKSIDAVDAKKEQSKQKGKFKSTPTENEIIQKTVTASNNPKKNKKKQSVKVAEVATNIGAENNVTSPNQNISQQASGQNKVLSKSAKRRARKQAKKQKEKELALLEQTKATKIEEVLKKENIEKVLLNLHLKQGGKKNKNKAQKLQQVATENTENSTSVVANNAVPSIEKKDIPTNKQQDIKQKSINQKKLVNNRFAKQNKAEEIPPKEAKTDSQNVTNLVSDVDIYQYEYKQQSNRNEEIRHIPFSKSVKPIPFIDLSKIKDEPKAKSAKSKVEIVPINPEKLLTSIEKKDPFIQNLYREIEKFLTSEMLVQNGSKVVVAVSGGVDSVAMLDIIANISDKYNFAVYVAHFNHNLRGEASIADEKFVRNLAASYNIPYYWGSGKVEQYASKNGMSIEESARFLRYLFLERTVCTLKADFLITAHTLDDSAETFLLNLFRGTGITGLSGIPSRRQFIKDVLLIRPFLNTHKDKLIQYAEKRKLEWREDESNLQDKYTRNKIRNELIPKLAKDYNSAIVDVINRSAKLIQGADRIIHDYVRTHLPAVIYDVTNDNVSIKVPLFKTFDEFIRGEMIQTILMKYFRMMPPSLKIIDRILKLEGSETGAICEISKSIFAVRDRQSIVISKKQTPLKINEKIAQTGKYQIGNITFVLKLIGIADVEYSENPKIEFFDANLISQTLNIRNWESGDEFKPLGMNGKTKISDFLTNEKIPILAKPNVLVITNNNDEVIWVCKHRISEKFKVTSKTTNILRIEIKEKLR